MILYQGFQRTVMVGCICMAQTLLDITDIPSVPGDIAVFIGKSQSVI